MLLMYILLAVFKNRLSNEHKVIDIETDTAADFSIMVTYLPKTTTEADIRTFFESEFEGNVVEEVSMAYDVEKILQLESEKDRIHRQLVSMVILFYRRILLP